MKSIWRIIRFTSELWPLYVAVAVFSILVATMSQIQPLLLKGVVDEITKLLAGGNANVNLVIIFAVIIFLTDIGQTFFSNIGGYMGDMLSAKLQKVMSQRYFAHLLTLPQHYFDVELSGRTLNRMNRGISQITNFIQILSNNFLQFIFSTILSLAVVFFYSWQVGIMLFVLYPIFVWLTTRTSTKWQGYQKIINSELDQATGRFSEAIGQIRVVKSFLREGSELSIFGRRFEKVVETTRPQSRYWHRQDVVRRLILNVIFFAVYAYIFVETAHGRYNLGTMVLLIQYATNIRIPIFSISFIIDQSQRAIANTRDYFAVMDEVPEISDHTNSKDLKVTNGAVTFNKVKFGYNKKQTIFKSISFALEPKSKTALVGESGEGKTTITSLLLRLYEAQSGEITIDEQGINDVTQSSLRGSIGVVFQEAALFSGTIRENIAYGRPGATLKQIKDAARAANADEFISKFEKGYMTQIGERGLKLSGGQKQRIAIARAILKDAPILILDEATSSLDSKAEASVQEALERLMKGRTTIIIAHRLSTIAHVDKIVTLKNGSIDEIGTPTELARTGGIYAELLKLQMGHDESTKKALASYEITA